MLDDSGSRQPSVQPRRARRGHGVRGQAPGRRSPAWTGHGAPASGRSRTERRRDARLGQGRRPGRGGEGGHEDLRSVSWGQVTPLSGRRLTVGEGSEPRAGHRPGLAHSSPSRFLLEGPS